jgi:hypothetical protein
MSTIRLRKTPQPSAPSVDKSRLYVDQADNHLKRILDNGTIVDYDSPVSDEQIQDAIGAIVTDTSTIDLTYDDGLNELKADIVQESINDFHIYQISPTKIGNDKFSYFDATLNTANNSLATAFILDCSTDGTMFIEVATTCFRTGGISGNPGDGASFKRSMRIKSIAGTVTIHDLQSDYTSRDNVNIKVEYIIVGTDLYFRVGGLNNNNFRWNLNISINKNS